VSETTTTTTQSGAAGGGPLRVNLGCGSRYRADWANYDLTPCAPEVRSADFINGIPLADGSAACVYHSHILEHLPRPVGRRFLAECRRVLAPGGYVRIVVPDLERAARDYLAAVDARRGAGSGPEAGARRLEHEWMQIELIDQMVRDRPGGEYTKSLAANRENDAFVLPRLGAHGGEMIAGLRAAVPAPRPSRFVRAINFIERWVPKGRVLAQALHRSTGEMHMWMYDELSLGDVLREVGFADVRRHTHLTSDIPGFAESGLDAEPDGTPWKGVSLYMEGRNPG
jgi:predicted SAM-dependent methyltransferase